MIDSRPNAERTGSLLLPSSMTDGATNADAGHPTEPSERARAWSDVPWRTIVAVVLVVGLAVLLATIVYLASRLVVWIAIAGFFAVVLARPVAWVERRLSCRKGAAIAVVVGSTLVLLVGLIALFVIPVRTQVVAVLSDLPGTVTQAAEGRGPVGRVVSGLHLEQLVRDNEATLTRTAASVQSSLPAMLGSALQAVLAIVTVAVMTCLMLSQSAALAKTGARLVPVRHRDTATQVARDAAGAVSGYMTGNLLISLCAGVAAFAFLAITGVPSAIVIALWVAFADLIPLVGATLGAVVAVVAAFLVSPTIGIVAIIFFVLYQQFENSVLQIMVMTRTVSVNPLAVLLSILLGVELFGFVGALLAVPVAGVLAVIAKELWLHRPRSPDELVVVGSEARAQPAERRENKVRRWLRRLRWPRRRPIGPKPGEDLA
jgi:predicted PurR-regulated permease PerM